MHEENSAVTTVNAARQKLFSQRCKAINTYISTEHQGCYVRPPGDGPKTKDNHRSHYGQHFVRLRTRARSWSTVAGNKAVKIKLQVCSCQLPMCCLMLLWRRFQCGLALWQHSNLQADFVRVGATSFLFKLWIYYPVGALDCDFWFDSSQIFRGFHWNIYHHFIHPAPVHKVTVNTIKNIIINLLLQLTYFYDFDLVPDLLWPFVQHDRQTVFFCKE